MKQLIIYFSIAIFSIFIGSQITEGAILVPYWKSLTPTNFYAYYNQFGPSIGLFYTVLTIVAALIPIAVTVYCLLIKSKAFRVALISSFFALLFILSFYIYFKGTNELFHQAALNEMDLKSELITWTYWHWGRIIIECLSLVFLMRAFAKIQNVNKD